MTPEFARHDNGYTNRELVSGFCEIPTSTGHGWVPVLCYGIRHRKAVQKKLRELDAEDLGKYSLKAVTTWGDEYDFKHFLPRILELWDDCVSHDMLFMKLQYLHWETWPPQEKDAIVVYFESILKSLWHEFSQLPDATLGEESSFEAWVIESDIEEISDFLSGKLICEDFTEN